MNAANSDADAIIKSLALAPHPEGGWFAETFRDPAPAGGRTYSTAIYYLLREGENSAWHRIDAAEIWHFYAGAPLELRTGADASSVRRHVLGTELSAGARPQIVVPPGHWQAARSLGQWTLVGCTVAPGFDFATFELADAAQCAALDCKS